MRALSWTLTALALPPAQENRNPEALGGVAPVGNGARWLIPANTKDSHHLPVPYSIAATDVENGHRTAALARDLLRNFTYKEHPDTEHTTIWYASPPVEFDFFDKHRGAAMAWQLE